MISKKQQANGVKPILQIDGINIESVDHSNFLGLTVDSRMTWNNHTTNISNKCSRTIGVLTGLKHFIPLLVRILLYNTLILPHFNHCITAWGYQCDRIIKLQKKAIRIISISTYNAHTEPYIQNWPLHANKEIHHHNTHHTGDLQTHRALHMFAENCLRYNLIRVVNNSPLCILNKLNTHSLTGFANYAKQIFIKKYQDNCTVQNCYTCLSINNTNTNR